MKGRRNKYKSGDATQSGNRGKPIFTHDVAVALGEKLGLGLPRQENSREGFGHLSPHTPLTAETLYWPELKPLYR